MPNLSLVKFERHSYVAGDILGEKLDARSYKDFILLLGLFSDTFYGELATIMGGEPERAMARDDIWSKYSRLLLPEIIE